VEGRVVRREELSVMDSKLFQWRSDVVRVFERGRNL
jgi:hypothetical protein